MIFIDKMKNLRIYKTQLYLPTLPDNKKKNSTIMLLSPNYAASKKLMSHNLFINKLRYSSYYIEKDLSYYINDKSIKDVDIDLNEVEENYSYQSLNEMTTEERNKLPDSAFGIPSKRKYPLDTEARVRSAIKFFNYCDTDDEKELASNIIKAMKKFNITDVNVDEKNRFSKYYTSPKNEAAGLDKAHICMNQCEYYYQMWKFGTITEKVAREKIFQIRNNYLANNEGDTPDTIPSVEEYYANKGSLDKEDTYSTSKFLTEINENTLNLGDKVMMFNEDAKFDPQLKRMLYRSRLKRRNDVIALYDTVQKDLPFIKYCYADLKKYINKNLFIDLYFYNNSFFENNTWFQMRGFNLYYDFMQRLINDAKYKSNGYNYNTIFIPVNEWDRYKDASVWNYRKNINPISIIYQLMFTASSDKIHKLVGDTNLIFVSNNSYFRLNLKEIEVKEMKQMAIRFKNFIVKMCTTEEFEIDEIDTSADNVDSPEVIRAKVVDNIDINKGIDITPQLAVIDKNKKEKTKNLDKPIAKTNQTSKAKKEDEIDQKIINKLEDKPSSIDKLSASNANIILKKALLNNKKMKLAQKIDRATTNAKTEDDVYDNLEYEESEQDTESLVSLLQDIQTSGDDSIDLTAGRAARMTELDQKLLNTEIKGKSIKDIIEEPEPESIKTTLDIADPFDNWKDLTYTNFDKNYDIDKDILECIRHLSTVSRPLSIREISVENTSTSEDRVETYSVSLEDYRGKRYSFKLDIPIMVDNRFLLRGNSKSIQTQLYNMPIIKTDVDTCQIISNYMKIFVYRFGDSQGRSIPLASKFIKAANKYKGSNIKFFTGNSEKVCTKYQLPIDYISISGYYSKIETSDFIIYFNQDEIRNLYDIKEGLGVPYLYNKKTKDIVYYNSTEPLINIIVSLFDNNTKYSDFIDLIDSASAPTRCAYSRCSIMNTDIPLVVICAYHEGLRKTLDKANLKYTIVDRLTQDIRSDRNMDWIKFNDGYVVFNSTYESSLLMNGLKSCSTEDFSIGELDNKNMYLEFLDDFGGRIKADGLENFYDLMIDPITKEVLAFYKFPTDYVSMLLYANALLADNKYIKHTDMSSRRIRRYELIAAYTYKVLADAYASYANQLKHSRAAAEFYIKQSAVIDKFLSDPISSDDSCINALRDIETTNAITTKGPSGMNSDRAYSLDKRTYDPSMNNVIGMSTGFAGNVGVTRQATIDANVEGVRGYVKDINGDTEKMSNSKTLTATEAVTPMGSTHDDPFRTAMTFIQTAKHQVRTDDSDPLLVTSGMDEAMPYLSTDQFAFKAKKNGTIKELTKDYIIIEYEDNTYDYINLSNTIKKNSDGGYFVPLKLYAIDNLAVGTSVTANQIVAYDKTSYSNTIGENDNIAYNIGKLAKIAIINTDEGFEDSGIFTEKLANSLATNVDLKYDMVIEKDTTIFNIAKVGDHVEVGDNLLVWQDAFNDEETDSLIKSLSSTEVSELGKRKLTSEVTGTVTDIKIFRTVDTAEMSDSLKAIVEAYEDKYNKLEKKFEKYGLDKSQIPAHYILPPSGKLKKAQDAVLFEFYVEYKDIMGSGDKAVFWSANKAVLKGLIPKGKEPYTEFRPNEEISGFASEVSIDKRMVSSTIIVGSLNKLLIELDRSVKDIMGIPYDDSTV
jgi:hypothetical protein